MVEMAHYPELHQRGEDTNPDNGRTLCKICHLVEHIEIAMSYNNNWAWNSLRLQIQSCRENGFHTDKYYRRYPKQFEEDQRYLNELLAHYGFNPNDV